MNLKLAFCSALACALLFGLVSAIFYFGDWLRLGIVTVFGFFVGALAAPEFFPKAFKRVWLYQLVSGVMAGIMVGLFFRLSSEFVIGCGIFGGLMGYWAPYWIKHIDIP